MITSTVFILSMRPNRDEATLPKGDRAMGDLPSQIWSRPHKSQKDLIITSSEHETK